LLEFALWGAPWGGAGPASNRPNILFLIADDMSWHSAAFAGDPVVKTPNLDQLASVAKERLILDFSALDGRGRRFYIGGIHAAMGGDHELLTNLFARLIARTRRPFSSSTR